MLLKRKVKRKSQNIVTDSGISSQGSSQSLSQSTAFRNPHPGFRVPRAGVSEQRSPPRSQRDKTYLTSPEKTPQRQVTTAPVNSKSNRTPKTPRGKGRRGDGDQARFASAAKVPTYSSQQPVAISTVNSSPALSASWSPKKQISPVKTSSSQSQRPPARNIRNQGPSASPASTTSNQSQRPPARNVRNQGPLASPASTTSNQSQRPQRRNARNQGPSASPASTVSNQFQRPQRRNVRNEGPPASPDSTVSNQSQRPPARNVRNHDSVVSPASIQSSQAPRTSPGGSSRYPGPLRSPLSALSNRSSSVDVENQRSALSSISPQSIQAKRLMNQAQVSSPSNISSDRSHAPSPTKTLKSEALTVSPATLSRNQVQSGLPGQNAMNRQVSGPRFDMRTLISKGPMPLPPAQRQGQAAKTFTAMGDNGKKMTLVRNEPPVSQAAVNVSRNLSNRTTLSKEVERMSSSENRGRTLPVSHVPLFPQKKMRPNPAAATSRGRNEKRKKPSVASRAMQKKRRLLHLSSDSESVFSTSDVDASPSRASCSGRSDTTEHSVQAVDRTIVKSERSRKDINSTKSSSNQPVYVFRFYSTWVECTRCLKWRVLLNVFDPSTLAEDWTCSMHPERAAAEAGCSAPEMRVSPEVEHSFVYINFSEGSIVWARVGGYPFWPAMVDRDPDSDTYIRLKEDPYAPDDTDDPPEVGWYHVTFLDKDVSRYWVITKDIKSFTGKEQMRMREFQAPKKFERMIKTACEAGEDALKLQLTDRIKRYGFAFRWTGKENRWVRQSFKDSHEVTIGPELWRKRKQKIVTPSNRSSQEFNDIKNTTTNLVKTADRMIEDLQRDFISYSLQSSQQSSQQNSQRRSI